MSETTDLLKECLTDFGKKAPKWAAGLAVVIITVSVAYTMMYMTSKETIDSYVNNQIHRDEATLESNRSVIDSMIKLANDNAAQLIAVSTNLHEAQIANRILTTRVDTIETDLKTTKEALVNCKGTLEACISKLKGK